MKNTLKVVLADDEADPISTDSNAGRLSRRKTRTRRSAWDMKLQVKPITVKMQLP